MGLVSRLGKRLRNRGKHRYAYHVLRDAREAIAALVRPSDKRGGAARNTSLVDLVHLI